MIKWFLDASFAIALLAPRDAMHSKAKRLAERIEQENIELVTTTAVLLEVGDELSKRAERTATVIFVDALLADPRVEVIDTTNEWFAKGFIHFRSRLDKEWGLTDCVSFVLMQDRRLTGALTADRHFTQAGFRALLLHESG